MDIWEKYNLEKNDFVLCKELPKKVSHFIYYLEKNDFNELYINTNGNLKLIVTKPSNSVPLLLFLKKYRPHPELLPKDLKHEEYSFRNRSSEDIYKSMQLMLKPMNTFEEFKERLLLATEELAPKEKIEKGFIYGLYLIFINDKDEMGKKTIDMHDKEVPWEYETYVYINKDKQIYEIYYPEERSNRYSLEIKFYEEHYIYEYLLNKKVSAII